MGIGRLCRAWEPASWSLRPVADCRIVFVWEEAPFDDFREDDMAETFNVGDHVGWNSEAGEVSGTITKVHTSDFEYKGHKRRASKDEPQYEIKSDKTDHIAAHKGTALHRIDK